ncbi:histidinol-phosphate transaminase [Subtercola boreus]|uniref:Aromatic amino acid aminotransferase n=1 Tax=Subtercola boreus TaxID=120213 RepID=A0A3E0WGN5_9MICO|nr:histidinol-phosphate transaminase [Subtercola boreus]RFA23691.1 aminotransferase [Subtercola boreus]RFA24083.1 aminotransferase [Subtercola boreus]RFA29783.1 aminotransferase [Subtercola boreus]
MTSPGTPPIKLRPEIVALPPYRQGRAVVGGFKLSSNENPFPPLAGVLQAAQSAAEVLHRYPNGHAPELSERLADRYGVNTEQVIIGAGSVAVLAQLVTAAAGAGDEVIYSWRSFEAYPLLPVMSGAISVQVPNRPDHGHDLPAMAAAITDRTRVIIVCTPNNPTSTIVTKQEFADFMTMVPDDLLVILDEAYAEFVTDPDAVSGIPLLGIYPNLVVLRTFSKAYGLAGLRIGYGVGPVSVIDAARSASIPLSVTHHAQLAAMASLDVEDELLERVANIAALRTTVWQGLTDQGWVLPVPQGNFVWLPTGEHTADAAEVFARNGIMARPFHPEGIRVSIGESESVDKLLVSAKEIVDNLSNMPSAQPIL